MNMLFLMNKTKDQISWVSSHDLYWENKMYKRKRSILSPVDLSKHLITAWIIQKFIQLVNFVTFSVFFFFFGKSSMVKPVWAGTFGKWATFSKETSIIRLQVASVYKNIDARIY